MKTLSIRKLRQVLQDGLHLRDPEFHLEHSGQRIAGSIISKSFSGQRDHQRQDRIWDLLEAKFGADSWRLVGMLFAFTPDEWDIKFDGPRPKRVGHAKQHNGKSSIA